MRSRSKRVAATCAVLVTLLGPAFAAQPDAAPEPLSASEITAAVNHVRADPNLGGTRTFKMLRWRDSNQPRRANFGWLSWVAGFFAWINQSARYLVWVTIVFLAAWLAIYLIRAYQQRSGTADPDAFVAPTHVRNLDIRPESLPANIGAAARALWDRGDQRAALSLLYRGLLSRLTHVHRVPIKDSTTEGDCLSLLAGRVSTNTSDYSTHLVHAWQAFVYGGAAAASPAVHALCDGFAQALDRATARPIQESTQ